MKRAICLILSILLLCAMPLGLAGCGAQTETKEATDLMADIKAGNPDPVSDLTTDSARLTDFALRLFKASQEEGKNTLVSPLSVLCALAMTANGAAGETRAQMETVLGMKAEELNRYLCTYMEGLSRDEKNKLHLANSNWFTDDERFTVNREFLQTNADYYGADLYRTPFNDGACKAINDWVKEKTEGMIPEILDRIPPDAIMYLVNALAFEAEWEEIYENFQVNEGYFTTEDGQRRAVEFMADMEHDYLETAKATGFLKYYAGRQYAFAALLPNEGISVSELLDSLTGAELQELLTHPEGTPVETAIPKFETDYDTERSGVLSAMGMPLAFDSGRADFSALGASDAGNIFINRVLHKTFISVTEQGTRAGAATVVEMNCGAAMMEDMKTVILDRPFVYMLVDCRTGTPFFIGTMMDPGK